MTQQGVNVGVGANHKIRVLPNEIQKRSAFSDWAQLRKFCFDLSHQSICLRCSLYPLSYFLQVKKSVVKRIDIGQ